MDDFMRRLKDIADSIFKKEQNKTINDAELKKLTDFIEDEKEKTKFPEKTSIDKGKPLDKLEFKPQTDEEISANSQKDISLEKEQATNKLNDEIKRLENSIAKEKESAEMDKAEVEKKLNSNFDEAAKKTDSDVLKRGLARSSIAALTKSGLENQRADTINKVASEYANKISELDKNLAELSDKRETALDDFDIAYAAKLTEKINALKEERSKKQEEVIKYNNTITEKENKAENDRLKLESDLYSDALSQYENVKEMESVEKPRVYYNKLYIKMRDMLRKCNPIDAKKILKDNPIFKDELSNEYYFLLTQEFN